MDVDTIGILSTGQMGSSIARTVGEHGVTPLTSLAGRSQRTRENAREAGVEDVPMTELVDRADLVLSVVVPAAARDVLERVAEAAGAVGTTVTLVELNPIAPDRVRAFAEAFGDAVDVVDGSIVGPASALDRATVYLSGPRADAAATLAAAGLRTEVLGPELGQASGLKLCYAGMTKGLMALGTDLLLAARAMDVGESVMDLFERRFDGLGPFLDSRVPGNPASGTRRAEEMAELARAFEASGVDDALPRACADRLRWVGSLGIDTSEEDTALATVDRVFEGRD